MLAEKTERVDPQIAYTAGLVCDLGQLAIAHACGEQYPAIKVRCAAGGLTWSQAEREVLGYTHGDASAQLLRAWNFPTAFVSAAEFAEHPSEAPEEARSLLAHLHAAKYVATSFGPGVAEAGFLFEVNSVFLLEWGFTAEMLQEAMTIVHDRAHARLQDQLTHGAVAL